MNRPNRPPRRLCLLLALLLGILPGCGRSAAPSRSADGIRVGVALYQQNDTFIATIVSSLEAAAREREADEGLKITLNITDGRGSQATQNEQIDRFLSTGYDVICVNLVDRTAAAVIVDKAKSAGIPLIFFNREPVREDIMRWDKVYYVGAEAGKSGVMQGELVAEAYRADPEALDRSGDGVLQYVMLEGEPGHQDSLLRTEYSIKAVTSANVTTEKLANDTGQYAATVALDHPELCEELRQIFERRRSILLDGLAKIDGIRCNRPNGAFYVFADISSFGLSSVEFCNRLLDEQKVVCIPGSAFGECGEGFIRIAYTCSDDELHEALKRISRFCSELRAA